MLGKGRGGGWVGEVCLFLMKAVWPTSTQLLYLHDVLEVTDREGGSAYQ